MVEIEKNEVRKLLKELKRIIRESGLIIIYKDENIKGRIELGMTIKTLKDEVLSLSVLDYSQGPLYDVQEGGDLWVFGKEINGKETYMKFKIFLTASGYHAKCLSIHPANKPMKYPFKE